MHLWICKQVCLDLNSSPHVCSGRAIWQGNKFRVSFCFIFLVNVSPWGFTEPQEKLLCKKSPVPMPSMASENWPKKVSSNGGCHVHISGKKIAPAISYWGIWEHSPPKPVPWGWPSVVSEPAPNPLLLIRTVEKLVVRQTLDTLEPPVSQGCLVLSQRMWQALPPQGSGASGQHREPQWLSQTYLCVRLSFTGGFYEDDADGAPIHPEAECKTPPPLALPIQFCSII